MNQAKFFASIAAAICAGCYLIGFAFLLVLLPEMAGNVQQKLQVTLRHPALLQLWYTLIYILFGLAFLLLNISLQKIAVRRDLINQMEIIVGYMWTTSVMAAGAIAVIGSNMVVELANQQSPDLQSTWLALQTIQEGLGGGVEILGACWMLMVTWRLSTDVLFQRTFSLVGYGVGLAGLATLLPNQQIAESIFGLGQLGWFAWLAVIMLRQHLTTAEHNEVGA